MRILNSMICYDAFLRFSFSNDRKLRVYTYMNVCVCVCVLSQQNSIETHNLSFLKTFQKMSSFCPCQMLLGSLLFFSLQETRCVYIYIRVCVWRETESGCRRILYSLLLRTAPSHLQLLCKCVCCRKIVICVSDGEK